MTVETEKEQRSISFTEIAQALANDYETVYVIDADDSYIEYRAIGDPKELVEVSRGPDFYAAVPGNCRALVHPEDQQRFLDFFQKEKISELIQNKDSLGLDYRLLINGTYYHYFLKTISGSNRRVIIGVKNIDDLKKRELAAVKEKRTYMHIAGALASRYEVLYYVNIKNDSYIRYSSSDEYAKLGTTREGTDFFADCESDIKKYIHKDDMGFVLTTFKKAELLRIINERGSLSMTYRQQLGDDIIYVSMICTRPKNDDEHIVIGVMNIDAQMKREQKLLSESKLFNDVALALALRYEVIYRVNVVTNEYYEYSASEKYSKLEIGATGRDFFKDSQRNMKTDIYPDDYEMMSKAMNKDNLLRKLALSNKIFLNYRLLLDGRPQYVSLVVLRQQADSEHIIVAVENVDEAKRRELEFEAAIDTAMDMANKDSLTGVKNKHAYVNAETVLDDEITKDKNIEFAVAVCDINGLKDVNDNQGHNAGDVFIREACTIICEIFTHSPVFRVGGDEFAVILKGNDYKNRHTLFKDFATRQHENAQNGLVTLAYGMTEYVPGKDNRVQDVFERADKLMYENKRRFKAGLQGDEALNTVENYSFVSFYELYEQLLKVFVSFDTTNVALIEDLLIKIADMFRLAKGVTRVYRTTKDEAEGKGETFCAFDKHIECKEIHTVRVTTSVMTSATMTVYMSPDEPPLSDEEFNKVDLVMRTVLSFISRNRLRDLVYDLAYFDEFGYPNLRSWNQQVFKLINTNAFAGKMIFRYNLRHFSLINQEFGRSAGDMVIRKHYDTLRYLAGDDGFLARLGGDNFIGFCSAEYKERVVDYLTEACIRINEMNSVNLATSAGIYVVPESYVPSMSDLMEKVITTSRIAQTGGRDHIVFFSDSILERKERGMKVQQQFPDALRRGEFLPFYQPKVNVNTGELVGAEALCRWVQHNRIVPPIEFIPPLEQTNDICKLDLYMLERVCMDLRRWIDEGRDPIRISVNFSRKHILNVDLPMTIEKIVDTYKIPHEYIEIELTETTIGITLNDMKRIVTALRNKGFITTIDDFGMGASSLNLISDIPWNVIKVDKSFLPTEEDAPDSIRRLMFKSVVTLTLDLGLECIAEGVETKYQVDILKANNCGHAQGYFYDKPLPVNEFEKRMSQRIYDIT